VFGNDFRIENIIFKPRDESLIPDEKFTIIQKQYLEEVYYLQTVIEKSIITNQNKNFSVKDLCWTAFQNGDCVMQSPMNYWQGNIDRLHNDDDLQATLNCFKTVDPSQNIACMDANKIPVQEKAVFGGIKRTKFKECSNRNAKFTMPLLNRRKPSFLDKFYDLKLFKFDKVTANFEDESEDPCNESTISAKVFLVTYLLRNEEKIAPVAAQFEKDVIKATIEKFNAAADTSIFKDVIPDIKVRPLNLKLTYMLEISINEELEQESKQNAFIVIISYSIMFLYISLSLGNIFSLVGSNILLSLCGIFFILASVFMSYCLCAYLEIKASLISLEVIPFLILAIGVDNMFLIYHAVSKVPSNYPHTKIGVGLRSISSSVTLSSFAQILTFAVGLYIDIPALKTFCLTAMFALMFNYIFQVSAIPALLAIDLRRKAAGYCDLLPFYPTKNRLDISKPDPSYIYGFFKKVWKPLILSKPCKFLTFVIMISLFGLFFFAMYDLPLGLEQQLPVLKDGNLYNYFGDLKEYIEIGPIGSLIIENADYTDPKTLQVLDGLVDLLSKKENLTVPPFRIWYKGVVSLRDMSQVVPQIKIDCFRGVNPDDYINDFKKLTEYYLKFDLKDPCCSSYGLCGGQFYEDVEFKSVGLLGSYQQDQDQFPPLKTAKSK